MDIKLPPLALYVHVPWCIRKCPYCDFNSYTLNREIPEAQFITALLEDLEYDIGHMKMDDRPLTSIFIGGGTPSLISGQGIARLLKGIMKLCSVQADVEISLEANPGAAEAERFSSYRNAGVNRLSIGVQSFNTQYLQALGRIHNGDEATQAVAVATMAGFTNLNIDLMFGLPGQTVATALQDLRQAFDLRPTHISWYQLTLEPGSAFFHAPPSLPNEDLLWAMHKQGLRLLKDNHFERYEVSAYARRGQYCQHNLNYWRFGDYLGIGPGAHGKVTDSDGKIYRTTKCNKPANYLNCSGIRAFVTSTHRLEPNDLLEEFLLNAMRLRKGFNLDLFEERTGLKRSQLASGLAKAKTAGLVTWDGEQICATPLGYRFLNQLLLVLYG